MKTCYVMVGLPASGKSFRVKEMQAMDKDVFVYSTDDFIEHAASLYDTTYDELFSDMIEEAQDLMNECLDITISEGGNVIWDQTNLGIKKRSKIINRMKSAEYSVVCECFLPPETVEDIAEWNRRLHSRKGKTIPENILTNMAKTYAIPTLDEGFDEVTFYNIYGEKL